jgi:hypothetical protein
VPPYRAIKLASPHPCHCSRIEVVLLEMKSGAVQDDAAITRVMDGVDLLTSAVGCQLEAPVRATFDLSVAHHPR